MPNLRKTKFLPPLKSMADLQTLRMMRDAVNSLLNAKFVGGDIYYSDSNVIYSPGVVKTSGGLNFRGEYSQTASYKLNDLVIISQGSNAGTFVWINQSSGNTNPTTGAPNWAQLPMGGLGAWM